MAGNHGHWSQGLIASMNDPDSLIDSDDKVVVIKDKYPKARFHFLVLPKTKIASLKALTASHVDLLEHMHTKGEEIANRASQELRFRLGYHAVPSMSHLHMHIISQDFNSPCLKTKKHWNSFNTSYFIDSYDVIQKVIKDGRWSVDAVSANDLLKEDLKCHVCDKTFSQLPRLKEHIVLHDATKSTHGST